MNSRIRIPFYIFFLSPDYVAARSLRSLRSNNKFSDINCLEIGRGGKGEQTKNNVHKRNGTFFDKIPPELISLCLALMLLFKDLLLRPYLRQQTKSIVFLI